MCIQRSDHNVVIFRKFYWICNSVFSVTPQHTICYSLTRFVPFETVPWDSTAGYLYHASDREAVGSWLIATEWRGVIYGYGQLDWLGADLWPGQPFFSPCLCRSHTHMSFLEVFFAIPPHTHTHLAVSSSCSFFFHLLICLLRFRFLFFIVILRH